MKEHQSANVVIVNQSRWPLVLAGLGLAVVVCVCSFVTFMILDSASEPTPAPVVRTATPQTQALEPVAVPGVTTVPALTMPAVTEPTVLAEFAGEGNTVTDNFKTPVCRKAVVHWTAASSGGDFLPTASLIVHLFEAGGEEEYLINQLVLDPPPEGINGVVAHPLLEGEHYFSTENTDGSWTLRVECWDEVAPVGSEMNLAGRTATVTDNYELPACKKSVFVWSVEPDDSGSAVLSVNLFKTDKERPNRLINEHRSDSATILEGRALNRLSDGLYWLAVEHASGPWTIRWECQD